MLYEMTQKQLDELLSSCRPTPVMLIGGVNTGASAQENANKAWARLGKEMGFDPVSVQPKAGRNTRFFTANPVTPTTQCVVGTAKDGTYGVVIGDTAVSLDEYARAEEGSEDE